MESITTPEPKEVSLVGSLRNRATIQLPILRRGVLPTRTPLPALPAPAQCAYSRSTAVSRVATLEAPKQQGQTPLPPPPSAEEDNVEDEISETSTAPALEVADREKSLPLDSSRYLPPFGLIVIGLVMLLLVAMGLIIMMMLRGHS